MIRRLGLAALLAFGLAGCSSLAPDKPVRPTLYDLGPAPAAASAVAPDALPLVLSDVDVAGSIDSSALSYRLGYADAHQLRAYSLARWSAPPAQLLRQRLREVLGRDRPVLDAASAGSLARRSGVANRVLRIEVEDFTHHFDSATESRGVVRMRCTLLENTAAGERLVAQRTFHVARPAPSADAPGGVRAIAAATDAAAAEIAAWLQQQK